MYIKLTTNLCTHTHTHTQRHTHIYIYIYIVLIKNALYSPFYGIMTTEKILLIIVTSANGINHADYFAAPSIQYIYIYIYILKDICENRRFTI